MLFFLGLPLRTIRQRGLAGLAVVLALGLLGPAQAFEPTKSYTRTNINGWTVYISSAFAKEPAKRNAILAKLKSQTAYVANRVSSKHLRVLRKSDIWVEADRHYRSLARYHGSKGEIFQENLNPQKYRDIEVFGNFARVRHPSLVLHELAHVYQDRKLNWYDAKIKRIFAKFEKRFAKAKDRCGVTRTKAYALTHDGEFFATFTEAWFGKTCTYPHDRETIRKSHPEMYAVLAKVWGQ